MNILNRIEMSSLINHGALVKWEYMSGGMMKIIPLYEKGYLLNNENEERILHRAKKFLESALEGIKSIDERSEALPQGHIASSRNLEISLRVFLSSLSTFQVQKWDSVKEKLTSYKEVIKSLLEREEYDKKREKDIRETRVFFKTLAEISHRKRVASVFSHGV